jgi:uncharacterized protein (DUF427 family)
MFQYYGQRRPDFADKLGPDQESVWDYPRPPRLEATDELVEVFTHHAPLASSRAALRLLETASPPTYYIPANDINWRQLVPTDHTSYCEWKGQASYFALADDPEGQPVAWLYASPSDAYAGIDQHASFYPGLVRCEVKGEHVMPQPGAFYGGWITNRVVGPFKGEPGTGTW